MDGTKETCNPYLEQFYGELVEACDRVIAADRQNDSEVMRQVAALDDLLSSQRKLMSDLQNRKPFRSGIIDERVCYCKQHAHIG